MPQLASIADTLSTRGHEGKGMKPFSQRPLFFILVSITLLYMGYAVNFWKATDYRRYFDSGYSFITHFKIFEEKGFPDIFWTFDRWSESLILGRLLKSKKDGLLSSGGFVGNYVDLPNPVKNLRDDFFVQACQYVLYLNGSTMHRFREYETYTSQPGGQALLLCLLDRVLPADNFLKLKFFYHLMAMMTAIAVGWVIFWFYTEFGPVTGIFLTGCFCLLCYPTLFAKSLWWVLWAYYIPFLFVLYFMKKEEVSKRNFSHRSIFILVFCGMLLKIFFNGYEFITTTMIMAATPLFYYAIKNRWPFKLLFHRCCAAGTGMLLAMAVFVFFLSLQFVLDGHRFIDGFDHVWKSFLKRSYGGTADALSDQPGNHGSLLAVLKYYMLYPSVFDFRKQGADVVLRMKHALPVFFIFTIPWGIGYRRVNRSANDRKAISLAVTLWISALAPISWFIVFKGHSLIHRVHDPIVWYMPFMFYGFALVGFSTENLILQWRRHSNRSAKRP